MCLCIKSKTGAHGFQKRESDRWNWSYPWLWATTWVLRINMDPMQVQAMLLAPKLSLQFPKSVIFYFVLCVWIFCLHVCLCTKSVFGTWWRKGRILDHIAANALNQRHLSNPQLVFKCKCNNFKLVAFLLHWHVSSFNTLKLNDRKWFGNTQIADSKSTIFTNCT